MRIYTYYASWPGAMINTHSLELSLSQTYFRGSKGVRAMEHVYMCILTDIILRTKESSSFETLLLEALKSP